MRKTMTVTVMSRDGRKCSVYEGHIRVTKNFSGDKWFVIKDLEEEEMKRLNTDEDYVRNEYPVDEYYIILN